MDILIAEDDSIARQILTAIVIKWGYNPIAVVNGCAVLKRIQHEDPPQIALMDSKIPEMDGMKLAGQPPSKARKHAQ